MPKLGASMSAAATITNLSIMAFGKAHSVEAEQCLLGALLLEPAAWSEIVHVVGADDLYRADHRLIFGAVAALVARDQPPDPVTVGEHLQRLGRLEAAGGLPYLAQLVEDTPSAANIRSYAKIVREHALRRQLGELGVRLAADAAREDDVEQFVAEHTRAVAELVQPRAAVGPEWPAPLSISAMLETEPEPPRWVIPDWLPAGYATLFAGHGGSGKSYVSLHLAASIAAGRAWHGLTVERRRVLYLSCEDRAPVLHWRLAKICTHERLLPADLVGRLHVVDLVGHDAILFRRGLFGAGGVPSAAIGVLERLLRDSGSSVLVVDGVADVFAANENDRGEVKQFVNMLVSLVGADGVALAIHHVNRSTAAGPATSEGYSGSTSWNNSVRARWYLRPEIETTDEGQTATGTLILGLHKSNLGRTDQTIRLRWDDDAHLFVAEGQVGRYDRKVQDTAEQRGIVEAIREVLASGDYVPAAAQGPRTAYHVLVSTKAMPDTLKNRAGKRRFWRHIETLRRNRIVRESSIRRSDRHIIMTIELEAARDKGDGGAGNAGY